MSDARLQRMSMDELEAEGGTALPAKEVISLLNLDLDLDLALALAAPVDLAIAANANVAAPINAAVSANVLSLDSSSTAAATQDPTILQDISGEAIAEAPQTAVVDQSADPIDAASTSDSGATGAVTPSLDGATDGLTEDATGTADDLAGGASALLSDGLLNIDVNAAVDADIAAPIAGAVAANANVAAPINAAVSANIASVGSESIAIADQNPVIEQQLDDVTARAEADQDAKVIQ